MLLVVFGTIGLAALFAGYQERQVTDLFKQGRGAGFKLLEPLLNRAVVPLFVEPTLAVFEQLFHE